MQSVWLSSRHIEWTVTLRSIDTFPGSFVIRVATRNRIYCSLSPKPSSLLRSHSTNVSLNVCSILLCPTTLPIKMPIDLYGILASPPFRATLVLAKHLKLDVNVKDVDLQSGAHKTPEFLKASTHSLKIALICKLRELKLKLALFQLNPVHTVPTLVDNGESLWESRAILAYLINKYQPNSPLYPQDALKRGKVDAVLYFEATALYPAFLAILVCFSELFSCW